MDYHIVVRMDRNFICFILCQEFPKSAAVTGSGSIGHGTLPLGTHSQLAGEYNDTSAYLGNN